jgi:uncharacterized membrane protein YfcA
VSIGRQVFLFLKMASEAHARWDYEVSMSILRNRKRLLILFLLLLPILAVGLCEGAAILGGKTAYAPANYSTSIFLVSIVIGLCAGLITGCIGAGGGFIITPALMAAGIKGILAVGTDLFHIFAKAIMGTAVHRKLGNVSIRLALAFLVGSGLGAVLGGTLNKALYNKDPLLSDTFISIIYAILLGFLGFYSLFDFIHSSRGVPAVTGGVKHDTHGGRSGMTGVAVKLQHLNIPPMLTFDEDLGGRKLSGVIVALGGLLVGVLAAIMGVGGGFITFPMFVYIFGVSSMTTVGTDILQIIFTAGLGAIAEYAIYGYVFYTLAMGMLIGSLIGIQLGALTTKVVKGVHIRGFYAISILAGFINRTATLPEKLTDLEIVNIPKSVSGPINFVGAVIFWGVVGFFGVWVLSKFFGNLRALQED